jgi:hypothetical protein
MKVAGDKKFNLWSKRQAKKRAKKGVPLNVFGIPETWK